MLITWYVPSDLCCSARESCSLETGSRNTDTVYLCTSTSTAAIISYTENLVYPLTPITRSCTVLVHRVFRSLTSCSFEDSLGVVPSLFAL